MLRAGSRSRVLSKVRLEQRQYRLEDGHERRARCFAALFKPLGKTGIDQRKEDDARRILDLGDDALELSPAAHQGIDMFDRSDALILGRRGSRGGDQRLAGQVRDQMKMEIAAAQRGPRRSIAAGYNQWRGLWTGVENEARQARALSRPGQTGFDNSQPFRSGQFSRPERKFV